MNAKVILKKKPDKGAPEITVVEANGNPEAVQAVIDAANKIAKELKMEVG